MTRFRTSFFSSRPERCPVCGEAVPAGALACPECGADERTGWKEDEADGVFFEDPESGFDYDDFVEREFGHGPKPPGMSWGWWLVGVLLLVSFAGWLIGGLW